MFYSLAIITHGTLKNNAKKVNQSKVGHFIPAKQTMTNVGANFRLLTHQALNYTLHNYHVILPTCTLRTLSLHSKCTHVWGVFVCEPLTVSAAIRTWKSEWQMYSNALVYKGNMASSSSVRSAPPFSPWWPSPTSWLSPCESPSPPLLCEASNRPIKSARCRCRGLRRKNCRNVVAEGGRGR